MTRDGRQGGVPGGIRSPARTAEAGEGLVDLGLILGIAVLVAVVAIVVFGAQLAAILDYIGAQVQQPG
jgi:hypothetical protein